jgi:hypothetical protein
LLQELLSADRFRYDPVAGFAERHDYYGLATRRNVLRKPAPGDGRLRDKLAATILAGQMTDGSWNGTVVSSATRLAQVHEIGLDGGDRRVSKGIVWLLSQCAEGPTLRRASAFDGTAIGHHMFSASDRRAEFKSAAAEHPEWIPAGACYCHLPMIQTGLAVKTLIAFGYAEEPRVAAACASILQIKERFGGWCNSDIKNGLLAEKNRAAHPPFHESAMGS